MQDPQAANLNLAACEVRMCGRQPWRSPITGQYTACQPQKPHTASVDMPPQQPAHPPKEAAALCMRSRPLTHGDGTCNDPLGQHG